MEVYTSLSKREKRYQFFYLIGLLFLGVAIISVLFLHNFDSPFSSATAFEIKMLDEKNNFEKQQLVVQPYLENVFTKINGLKEETPPPYTENDIKNSINQLSNSFESIRIQDPRKIGYFQIVQFYQMFFEDKKIAGKKKENIALFQKQFEECSIGFKDRRQQLNIRRNLRDSQ